MFCCLPHSQIFDLEEVFFVGEDLKKYLGGEGLTTSAVTVAQSVSGRLGVRGREMQTDLSCKNWW